VELKCIKQIPVSMQGKGKQENENQKSVIWVIACGNQQLKTGCCQSPCFRIEAMIRFGEP
jgi:hypothetical protein